MTDKPKGYFGQQGLASDTSESNALHFAIQQALGDVRTNVPVKIIAVHGGGVGAPPTVDVQPLINQIDGLGNKTDHGIIYGIPSARSQGGGNAIINDPKVGDIGMMHVSDRDMSSLKGNKGAQSNPGSFRSHDLADGVYHGPILNPANPDQYVQFTDTGLKVVTKGGCTFEMVGTIMTVTGDLHVTGQIIAGFGGGDSVNVQTHVHSGILPGGANTNSPVAGT
ncbi:MAG TPA: Gp138 family membrane-puncturing spike protein [Alphaproteobacteria bacterium]|nr:Gp138 family membrane-puncturing spike protein [Alphaproteobacteria bacterium]